MQMQTKGLSSQPFRGRTGSLGRARRRLRFLLWSLPNLVALCVIVIGVAVAALGESQRDRITKLIVRIQRADYEGDRSALKQLYDDLTPFADDKEFGAKVRYWRGFALWRRALNGSNENVAPGELAEDLKQAVGEFEAALITTPSFVDAKASAGATGGFLIALYRANPALAPEYKDPARMQESINKVLSYMNQAEAAEPENPRVWWVLGPVHFYLALQRGEGADKATDAAIEMYKKGLQVARARKRVARDPLIPTWGGPECLMSLAAANFYRTTPDLDAAEQFAREALALVPYWHYVRDILLPSILAAKAKREQQVSAVSQDRFFDSAGVRIHYVEQGHGTPLVLMHGYTGTAERHWINTGVFANLAHNYRVIAIDCRGHGKSDKPTNPEAYGAEMGKDTIRLLDHLKIRRAHIVGFSMGAIIAGHLLTTDADRFFSATLAGHLAVRAWTAADEQEAEASACDLESDTPFRSLILGIWPTAAPAPSEEEIRKRSQAMVAVNDPKALAAYHRGRSKLIASDAQIARVRAPVLGIIGSADPSLAGMQELKKVMPALFLVVVEGAAHGGERGVLRHPQFIATLREFLASRS